MTWRQYQSRPRDRVNSMSTTRCVLVVLNRLDRTSRKSDGVKQQRGKTNQPPLTTSSCVCNHLRPAIATLPQMCIHIDICIWVLLQKSEREKPHGHMGLRGTPVSIYTQTQHRLSTQLAQPLRAPHTHVSSRHQHWHLSRFTHSEFCMIVPCT